MDRKRRSIPVSREAVGLALLVGLLLAGLYTSVEMGRSHNAISRQLEDSAWYALSGDWEQARTAAAAAESSWESRRSLCCMLSDHTPMEQADALFARIGLYSAARDGTEFAAACGELSRQIQAMGDAHRLTWQNLF